MVSWVPLVNGRKDYLVNANGEITGPSGKALKPARRGGGYLYVNTSPKNVYVHRAVAEAFVPNPHNLPEVNHIDGNKENNRASNLEWVTRRSNVIHQVDNGLHCKVRLCPYTVRYLRTMYLPGDRDWGVSAIARRLGMSKAAIGLMLQGATWRHVE